MTGCLAERYREEVSVEIPEADVVLGIGKNKEILQAIRDALDGKKTVAFGDKYALPLEGPRILANAPYFAYLKVADGCDNRCSYCAIPLIRGGFRSRPVEKVVEEAKRLADAGVTELNVVAQDTTRYGEDLYGRPALPELLEQLCRVDGIRWVRILYCYPDRITDQLLEVMAREEKIVKYMDIPIQHVSGRLLKLMNRRGDADSLTALMRKIRERVPGVVLRTTLITGFPTESEADFSELCTFIREVKFERLGCFPYSAEEDTPAAEMDGQIDEEKKRHRAEVVMEEQYRVLEAFNASQIGRRLTVLVEGRARDGLWYGRSYMDAPDIDTKIFFTGPADCPSGSYVAVEITGTEEYDLLGRMLEVEA